MTKYQIGDLIEFKSDIAKKKEFYDSILATQSKIIEESERRELEMFDENDTLRASTSSLQGQLDQYIDKISAQELEISKMRSERKV